MKSDGYRGVGCRQQETQQEPREGHSLIQGERGVHGAFGADGNAMGYVLGAQQMERGLARHSMHGVGIWGFGQGLTASVLVLVLG